MIIGDLLLMLLVCQLIYGMFLWLQVKDLYKYPNHFGIPIIGNLLCFYRSLLHLSIESFCKYYTTIGEKYGQDMYFTFSCGSSKTIVITCPKILEAIAYHPHIGDKPKAFYSNLYSTTKGIFSSIHADEEWKIRKKELNYSMNKNKLEGLFQEEFITCAKILIKNLESDKKNVDILLYSFFVSLNSVKATLFGAHKINPNPELFRTIKVMMNTGTDVMVNPILGSIFYYVSDLIQKYFMNETAVKLKKQLICDTEEMLQKFNYGANEDKKILPLPVLISLRNKIDNIKVDTHTVEKELTELLLAGSHTTAAVISAGFIFLSVLPEIQDKVWEEQYNIFGNSNRDPTVEDLREMVYMDRFIKEVMRFIASPFIVKFTSGEINLEKVTIPSGTVVVIPLLKMRMDPRYWKKPDKFDPDRFIGENDDRHKFSYLPFGLGARSCPGMQFAMNFMKIVFSIVLRRYKLSSGLKFEELSFRPGLMNEIANKCHLQVKERSINDY